MTASIDVLWLFELMACVAFVAACFGWAGGKGGLLSVRAELNDLRTYAEGLDRRLKSREGQAGQAVRQEQRKAEAAAIKELEAAVRAQQKRPQGPPLPSRPMKLDEDGNPILTAEEIQAARRIADGK